MKTIRFTLTALLGALAVGGLRAADSSSKPTARVDVTYSHPDKFTDAAQAMRGSDFGLENNLDELTRFIIQRATPLIPKDDQLTVTFTDIDLAGEYEPWRSPGRGGDVRIIKDIYIPRMELSFKLTDASGKVLQEGVRHLTNTTFMMDILPVTLRNEPLAYDKAMLGNWLQDEFGGLKR